MSSWQRRHSQQLDDQQQQHQQQSGNSNSSRHRGGQPLVRTRSSAQLLLGQLTGTCSSLLRRLSVKVRYLSLSLIPTTTGSSPSPSRHSSPNGRERPRSADRSGPSGLAGRAVRPRRHTTTVITTTPAMMNESTPVLGRAPSPLCPRGGNGQSSPSPGSDSEATPTPSPCHFTASHQVQSEPVDEETAHYLRTDDYATLKASSSANSSGQRRRRRHDHGNQRKNQTERRRTGSDDPHQPMTVITAPLLLAPDQPFSGLLDLNLNGAKGSGYLAHDQQQQQQQQLDRRRMASSADLVPSVHDPMASKSNPYLDWYFNCGSGSGAKDSDNTTGGNAASGATAVATNEDEIVIEDLPYPILLDEWLASPPRSPSGIQPPSSSGDKEEQDDEEEDEEEEDPLEALEHHTSWFEEFAYPAYSSGKASAGVSKSHSGSCAAGAGGTASGGRVMTEKAYPYVSSPVSPRAKHRQLAPYDPYDLLLYDESAYLASATALLDAEDEPVTPTTATGIGGGGGGGTGGSFLLKPVPSKSHPIPSASASENNSERGVHPGPESLPPTGLESNATFLGVSGGGQRQTSTNNMINNNNNNSSSSNLLLVNASPTVASSSSSKFAPAGSLNASATVSHRVPCL